MRWMKYFALATFAVLASGCVTNFAPPLKSDATPSTANGVIAAEFSRTSTTGIAFIVHNTKTGQEYALSIGENTERLQDVYEQVSAINVPPGDYAIVQWETFESITKQVLGKFPEKISRLAKPFTVQAGQVTFLGAYFAEGAERYAGDSAYKSTDYMHWIIDPQSITYKRAHASFVRAYPAYSESEFTCLLCSETLKGFTTHVKDVRQNPYAYLTSQFSPGTMAPAVTNLITEIDKEPAHFARIVAHLTWHNNVDDPSKASSSDEVRTLLDVSGPFVEILSESSRSGMPIAQSYSLSYRGMLVLKNQRLDLSEELAPPPTELNSVLHFDPMSSTNSGMQFSFSVGTHIRGNKSSPGSATCTNEGSQPASALNPSLSGNGIKVDCKFYNAKSELTSTVRYVYLSQYGVGIPLNTQTAKGRNEAKLTSITVE